MTESAPRKNAGKTRGRPFQPGNPGRPAGSRHATTILAERLMSDDVESVVAAVLMAAKSGDMVAARIVMDRLAPVRKGAPVPFGLPPIATAEDVDHALSAVTVAMAAGDISPDEASTVAGVIELRRRSIETDRKSVV